MSITRERKLKGHDPFAVANNILDVADELDKRVTPMKLQKLMFYAHGWHLEITDNPLVNEPFQAWRYGPVCPSVYEEFIEFGNKPITRKAFRWYVRDESDPWDDDGLQKKIPEVPEYDLGARSVIRETWRVYGDLTALQLSDLSHTVDPWITTIRTLGRFSPIDNDAIREYFTRLRQSLSG